VANAAHAVSEDGELVVEGTHGNEHDIIVIRDNGTGLDPAIRDRLFEPLVTTKAHGTGLGLNICRRIVERHGGRIELIDPDGRGAAFRITLPSESDRGSSTS